MTVITIRELQATETGFEAELSFDGTRRIPITITNPFTPKEERCLEWYFEEWLRYPMLHTAKAEAAATSVRTYGEQLFEQVFSDRSAIREYDKIKSRLNQVQIEIENRTPEFQALHWEALKDPELPRPFAVNCIMLRKYCEPVAISAAVNSSPHINVLVVVARPDEERDVGYRTISRPLIEVIENSHLPVNVELLRPGTYEALSKHLEEKGAGYYHILHFDGHGALMTYEQVISTQNPAWYFYKGCYGQSDIQPFLGVKAFLAFEQDEAGKVNLVEATEFANLLTGKNIPVCLLNACQSGKQIDNVEDYRETSLGSRLMAAGMQMVVAMSYSVTGSAAKIMMQQLYQHLLTGKEITEAIRLGRLELYNNKKRNTYFNHTIELEDWLLPVVYSNQTVNFNLREFTPAEEEQYWEQQGRQYHFPSPEYGFVGRDLEILKIEKALLRHNILLLRGMGGTGKTTLLNHLRQWWQTTHFAEKVFYFGYDKKAYTVDQILHEIGKQVYDQYEQAKFQTMDFDTQMSILVQKLKTEPHILILDNLESVTGQKLAIQNTLPLYEQQRLKDFLNRLVGGKTKVVLGSRSEEYWLRNDTFKTNLYSLQGLDIEARSILAKTILERHSAWKIEKIQAMDTFQQLMKLLAGYPLAMEVVLANLKKQSPSEILEALQAADLDLDTGSQQKTTSILKCVEYSHSNLSPAAQKLLLCLAPFRGFIYRPGMLDYAKQLQKLEPFQDYDFDQFNRAIQEAIDWGLLSTLSENIPELLTIQPVFPYFLKYKLKALDTAIPDALQEGFKRHYQDLGRTYNNWIQSKDAEIRKLGINACRLEYENLYTALEICIQQQDSVSIVFCLTNYLVFTHDIQTLLKLLEWVAEAQAAYPDEMRTGETDYEVVGVLFNLADCYEETRQAQKAKVLYEKAMNLNQQLQEVSETKKQLTQASSYHNLGKVAFQKRQWQQAQTYYQQALDLFIEYNDRLSQAKTYNQLGLLAKEQKQWQDAQTYYQKALSLFIEYNDRYSQAAIYHNLGILASEQQQWQQAQTYYQQALNLFIEYNDRYSQAKSYGQLGIIAQGQQQWQDAQTYYQQALDLFILYDDLYSQAVTYNQLGHLAGEQQQWQQALTYYQQALNLFIKSGDRYELAAVYNNLGIVAEEQQQWQDAQTYYRKALNLFIESGDRNSQAQIYLNLGAFATEQRQWQDAQTYYQQALDLFIKSGDRNSQAQIYYNLGMLAKEQRQWQDAQTYYQQALDISIKSGDRNSQARIYYNLGIVAQKQRQWQQAQAYYQQALDLSIKSGDRNSQARIYYNLGIVAQKQRRQLQQAQTYYQQALNIWVESSDRFLQAFPYGQLGVLAKAQEDWEMAKTYGLQALEIFAEFKDKHHLNMTFNNLARLYQTTQDESLLTSVAVILGIEVEEVRRLFDQMGRLSP